MFSTVAAAAAAGLDAHAGVGAVGDEVLRQHVAHAAGHFRADHDRAVALEEGDVADDDVLRRPADAPAVAVAAALERDAVVAGVERAFLDQHAVARIGVEAVGVRAGALDGDAAGGDVGAVDGVQRPEGRVGERDAFEQDALAVDRLEEARPQAGLGACRTRAARGSSSVSPISRSFFIAALALLRIGHHCWPWPSIVPSPVMAMSVASWP